MCPLITYEVMELLTWINQNILMIPKSLMIQKSFKMLTLIILKCNSTIFPLQASLQIQSLKLNSRRKKRFFNENDDDLFLSKHTLESQWSFQHFFKHLFSHFVLLEPDLFWHFLRQGQFQPVRSDSTERQNQIQLWYNDITTDN